MIYLILAILTSAMISVIMRIGTDRGARNMTMFAVNYLVGSTLSFFYMKGAAVSGHAAAGGGEAWKNGMSFAVLIGLLSGALYLVTFALMQKNIAENGVVLAGTFMKLGVLIPTGMAILVFGERPQVIQLLGMAMAIAAIWLIEFEKGAMENGRSKYWLVILLISAGVTDSLANVYDKMGEASFEDLYLLLTFITAAVLSFGAAVVLKHRPSAKSVLFGVLIGVPNYFSSRFLLLSLADVPAAIAYPVYSISTVILITLAGTVIFKEVINRRKYAAIGLIGAALVLLSI